MINYEDRIFRLMSNTNNGGASSETPFFHHQNDLGMADHSGGATVKGMLLARRAAHGSLDMRYQHVNAKGELMTGICNSVPEVLADGRYRLRERWRWTAGDCSTGQSVLEETSEYSTADHSRET
jgi:hypothetical protein